MELNGTSRVTLTTRVAEPASSSCSSAWRPRTRPPRSSWRGTWPSVCAGGRRRGRALGRHRIGRLVGGV